MHQRHSEERSDEESLLFLEGEALNFRGEEKKGGPVTLVVEHARPGVPVTTA